MPRIEFASDQKPKIDDWIEEGTLQGKILKSDKITMPSGNRIEMHYTADDGVLVILEEADRIPDHQNILFTGENHIEELKEAGVIFELSTATADEEKMVASADPD